MNDHNDFEAIIQGYDIFDANDIEKYTEDIFRNLHISKSNKDFLIQIGLPRWAAPHIHLGSFDKILLPKLRQWPWGAIDEEWADSIFVLGSTCGNPICIKKNEEEVFVLENRKHVFMNSSIPHLAKCLIACALVIEEILKHRGENAFVDGTYNINDITCLLKTINGIDPPAAIRKAFWFSAIDDLIRRANSI